MNESEHRTSALAMPAGAYRFDPIHTFATFRVKHMIVGRVDGRFDTLSGSFAVTDDADRRFALIEVSIDAASVDTNVDARDEDLRSPRFFDAASFPALTFRGGSRGPGRDGDWIVDGDLTIRDVVRPVSFNITVRGATLDPHGHTRIGAMA